VAGIGAAPDLPGTAADSATRASGSVVVVDRATLAEGLGEGVPATLVWVAGPDAAASLAAAVAESDATLTTLDSWRADAQSTPVARALTGLFAGALVSAVTLAILAVALLVAAGSRERTRAMARLRVVGLSRKRTRAIARGEVAVPVIVASAVGVVVGLVLTATLVGSLGLQTITSQDRAPEPVFAWWTILVPVALGAFAWLAVGVGLRVGRTPRLGEVLRVT